ncbi:MAG: DEAD/DEAH box helicase family protein [Lachnospiraceae bacterium]|jgi:superfamily II DNA or RNA helicase/HKD family nuclease|nr:DEAD/DEAH box helicase family protein [Lachnospiraceae bacterium]
MVEYYLEEEPNVEQTDVMTGDRNRARFLYYQLKMSMKKAQRMDIIVSFLMESGVRLLLKDLKEALKRGVKIRLLTGNYLGITQPSALCLVKKELNNQVDLRFYNEKGRSFHPKAYIFHQRAGSEIYIGSSNISRSALTSGIEWNYRFGSHRDQRNFQLFYETFEDLFYHHSIIVDDEELRKYSKSWKRPAVAKDLEKYDEAEENPQILELFQPRGAQIEALYALEASRSEGAVKGLVQAATGVGKTYLAAFDSAGYEHVLFVAHREEILKQAAVSFRNVRKSDDYGFFNSRQKDTDKAVIFASVATLGKDTYLCRDYFPKDYFDYIVVDEFHHAVTDQYRKIIAYFTPKFLLGLTATPERMDGRNIYEICDYNVPYEISLKDAINKGMLVPFHYYGIFDKTDYSGFHPERGRYREEDLNHAYIGNEERYELIYRYYTKYRSRRALGFCSTRQHAEDMAGEFSRRGVPSAAVYSDAGGEYAEARDTAIEKLKNGEIRIIFSVDMFNEGVDITSVDMVMFLRPTESPVVFLQQLGRGLRRCKGKEYLNVLDFIGNYEKAGQAPHLLSGNLHLDGMTAERLCEDLDFPDGCMVDFDLRLMDLFQEMARRNQTVKERIRSAYYHVKELLGKVPNRMELFTYMDDAVYQLCLNRPAENPFRKYLEFLHELGELSEEEQRIFDGIGREFLALLETTDMQKSYKMPILASFYNDGDVKTAVTEAEVLHHWIKFFSTGTNWKDLKKGITYEQYQKITDQQHLSNARRNPVHFLTVSGKGFFVEKEGCMLAIREDMEEILGEDAFKKHMKDIISYRTMEYYRRRYEDRA